MRAALQWQSKACSDFGLDTWGLGACKVLLDKLDKLTMFYASGYHPFDVSGTLHTFRCYLVE